jgi:uncharacterized protein (DUF58 family)
MPTETPTQLIKRLNWTVLRPLAQALGGYERSMAFGPGAELEEMREYRPGDDVRNMDWNVTARMGLPYVRLGRIERAADVWFVLDVSQSLNWGTHNMLKRERALEFAVVLSNLLGRFGNRVGGLLFADKPLQFVPPGAGREHLLRLTAAAQEATRHRQSNPTDLSAALHRAFGLMQNKALLFIITDFLTRSTWQQKLRKLDERHEVVCVHVYDPRERELPDTGLMTFQDPETGRQLTIDTRDAGLRERYAKAAAAQAERVRKDVLDSGSEYLSLGTHDSLLRVLVRYINQRKRLRHPGKKGAEGEA